MKTRLVAALLGAAVVSCAGPVLSVPTRPAEQAAHAGAPAAAQSQWSLFVSRQSRFSVLFPVVPDAKTMRLASDKTVLRQFVSSAGKSVYMVLCNDRPADQIQLLGPKKELSLDDDAFLETIHSEAISRRPLVLDGYAGREIICLTTDGDREVHRSYVAGDRVYLVIVTQPNPPTQAGIAAQNKFLNSFAFLPASPPNTKP